jgi:ribosomal protein S18 acetylase RimI-like enzyme
MIHIESPAAGEAGTAEWVADLVAFCVEHPVRGLDEALARRLLGSLCRGADAVLDVRDDHRRLAVAAVIDTCENLDGSADLALVGQVAAGLSPEAVSATLARAEEVVRQGPRRLLDVPLDAARRSWEPVLRARGYAPAFSLFLMERLGDAPPVPAGRPLPPGWTWSVLRDEWVADHHRVVAAAFAAVPGAFVPPLAEMSAALRASRRRPLVLRDGDRLVAFCQVAVHDTPDGRIGEIRTLGRDPARRGEGIGDHLILRGIAELRAERVNRIDIEVAARNQVALRLYERHGFRVTEQVWVLRRPIG